LRAGHRSIDSNCASDFETAAPDRQIGNQDFRLHQCLRTPSHRRDRNLGLEKRGEESYPITLGGDPPLHAAIGERLGPGLKAPQVPDAIEWIVDIYLGRRTSSEAFIDTLRRVGRDAFMPALNRATAAKGPAHADRPCRAFPT
jgi:sulfite reductase (NADPH) hemoprotein beta-component